MTVPASPAQPTVGTIDKSGSVDEQAEVIAFLSDPCSWRPAPEKVDHIETHGAHVFLAGDRALKIKRAVCFAYMDFSTLERRRAVVAREVELNRCLAPSLYLGAVAITREPDGRLEIGGDGAPVEWAVAMRRFDGSALLAAMARRGPIDATVIKALAAAVLDAHRSAPQDLGRDVVGDNRALVVELTAGIRSAGGSALARQAADLGLLATRALDRVAAMLDARRRAGFVRRCHGDLHLANIVLLDGRPTLYDALEFDEALATIDTLYDLAFLLMDLDVRGHRLAANALLGHYVWLSGEDCDIEALGALPLFLALRAAVRAMVGLQRRAFASGTQPSTGDPGPEAYLSSALGYLAPPPPRLVAVGGLSGTGKSTLSALLAPRFGGAPGALHLRSDLERKALARAGETDRLPPEAYTREASAAVYDRLLRRARLALAAGHSVVVDAVFQEPAERQAVEAVARDLGVAFDGIWLAAPAQTMLERIRDRRHDASDATPDVALAQLGRPSGAIDWSNIDAGGNAAATLAAAVLKLGLAVDQGAGTT